MEHASNWFLYRQNISLFRIGNQLYILHGKKFKFYKNSRNSDLYKCSARIYWIAQFTLRTPACDYFGPILSTIMFSFCMHGIVLSWFPKKNRLSWSCMNFWNWAWGLKEISCWSQFKKSARSCWRNFSQNVFFMARQTKIWNQSASKFYITLVGGSRNPLKDCEKESLKSDQLY